MLTRSVALSITVRGREKDPIVEQDPEVIIGDTIRPKIWTSSSFTQRCSIYIFYYAFARSVSFFIQTVHQKRLKKGWNVVWYCPTDR